MTCKDADRFTNLKNKLNNYLFNNELFIDRFKNLISSKDMMIYNYMTDQNGTRIILYITNISDNEIDNYLNNEFRPLFEKLIMESLYELKMYDLYNELKNEILYNLYNTVYIGKNVLTIFV